DVDDERISLPVAARIAEPLADVGRQMRPAVHDDGPLPSLALADVVDHRDAARRLHDPPEADAGKLRQPAGQAPRAGCKILGTVMAVHPDHAVARRKLSAPRRRRRIVFAAGTVAV